MSLTCTRIENFDVDGDLTLAADLRYGNLTLTAVPGLSRVLVTIQATGTRAEEVADSVAVTAGPRRVDIEVPKTARFLGAATSLRLRVEVPEGTDLHIASGSGDVDAIGGYRAVEAHLGSGDVRVDHARRADIGTGSGNVRLGTAARAELHTGSGSIIVEDIGELRAGTGSGVIRARAVTGALEASTGSGSIGVAQLAGAGRVETGSGSVRIGDVDGDVDATTGSGSIAIDRLRGGRVSTNTASGSQRIGVAEGTALKVDANSVSGRVTSELGQVSDGEGFARTAEVVARSISGGITFRRA
ncbi:MAG: DUF4097 family beta strand repeat protein [Tessaracoccus sp.]|uniref:DUF4097 family beta strand repeat-containing protein n=1 Tax=Tessaracoccus sp. TaxID=1971211 RepID=UPI001EB4CDFE|nr:DUF4097 family beta strand repeat-containing protein [Tessaracoccus sp.]MBK7819625.1 DUF4097 family beta strand repeat protein [Tessaracoccus sp.]